MSLYETRHGETDWNVLKKVQGKVDIPLNNNGIEQAKYTRDKVLDKNIDLIICSPLLRARQTAEVINQALNVPILYDERISERDFGEFEGKKTSEFDYVGFWSYKSNYSYERAENISAFFKRIYAFLDDIIKQYGDKNILIVGHGGVSIPINCYHNGIPESDDLLSLVIHNCEVVEFNALRKMK